MPADDTQTLKASFKALDFSSRMKLIEEDQEAFWNSLSKDDQLKVFCSVVRRIYQGEIANPGSYRHVLYTVFGFGPKAYVQAQDAGYLALHNAIVDSDYDTRLLQAFCMKNNIDDMETKIRDFIL